MNNYFSIAPNFEYSGFCLTSLPCQHGVKINNENKRMNGVEIYKYCIENNYPVPKHFEQYKEHIMRDILNDYVRNNNIENFKIGFNEYFGTKHKNIKNEYMSMYLYTAISNNNNIFIDYFVKECNVPVSNEHINCCINNNHLELFKYLLPLHLKNSKNGNVMNLLDNAVNKKNYEITKYLFENYDISLHDCISSYYPSKLLIRYLTVGNNDNSTDLTNYLIDKSVEQRMRYGGRDIKIIKEKGFYDIFKEKDLI